MSDLKFEFHLSLRYSVPIAALMSGTSNFIEEIRTFTRVFEEGRFVEGENPETFSKSFAFFGQVLCEPHTAGNLLEGLIELAEKHGLAWDNPVLTLVD